MTRALLIGLLTVNASFHASGEPARWIVVAGGEGSPVTHYRLAFSLKEKPEEFVVSLTADSIYRLYVNGVPVASGPASGDQGNWRLDRIDIGESLEEGENLLAVVVWHPAGEWTPPVALLEGAPGFYLRGETSPSINTGVAPWKAVASGAYGPEKRDRFRGYFALGDFENFDASQHPWNWETRDFDDREWAAAVPGIQDYRLVPRQIPMLEHRSERLHSIRLADGIDVSGSFLEGGSPVAIPPGTKVTLLLDRGELTNAYPELTFSGGKDADIRIGYAESLIYTEFTHEKGDRNTVENKLFEGPHDRVRPDGGENRLYRPLWFRTFRYIQLQIETHEEPLVLADLQLETTGYPFKEIASFDAGDAELDRIWDVGWRTLRLCAVDNFYDCPFYERLQYAGDTRIQALVSVYVSGDTRLMRKAIGLFRDSGVGFEIPASRYPSRLRQVIPTFCNWWIAMVNDYRSLDGDRAFIEEMVPTIEAVVARFEAHTDPQTGLITFSTDDEWDFVDWADHLSHWSERKSEERTPSGLLTLNHIYGLQQAVEVMRFLGKEETADAYARACERLKAAVLASCWDESSGLLYDDPARERLTEHANLLGILTDVIPPEQQPLVMEKILRGEPSMTRATIYFRFYYNRALAKVGMADRYLDTLGIWRDLLKLNLTTWAEMPEPARSDCHAWGSSPNYEFLATVAGITPSSPGFGSVRIAPAPGPLREFDVQMPIKAGLLKFSLRRIGSAGLEARVTLPDGVSGSFEWNGQSLPLKPGEQEIRI